MKFEGGGQHLKLLNFNAAEISMKKLTNALI